MIHGCYNTGTGAVRVTDTATNVPKGCTIKETALDWNQQGPKGDRGPSNAYTTAWAYKELPANVQTSIASRTLPPGKYVVSAKAYLTAHGLNVPASIVQCALVVSGRNGGSADYSYATVSSNASGNVLVSTLPLENDYTYMVEANGGTATVWCESPQPAEAHQVKITAIQVESLD